MIRLACIHWPIKNKLQTFLLQFYSIIQIFSQTKLSDLQKGAFIFYILLECVSSNGVVSGKSCPISSPTVSPVDHLHKNNKLDYNLEARQRCYLLNVSKAKHVAVPLRRDSQLKGHPIHIHIIWIIVLLLTAKWTILNILRWSHWDQSIYEWFNFTQINPFMSEIISLRSVHIWVRW